MSSTARLRRRAQTSSSTQTWQKLVRAQIRGPYFESMNISSSGAADARLPGRRPCRLQKASEGFDAETRARVVGKLSPYLFTGM